MNTLVWAMLLAVCIGKHCFCSPVDPAEWLCPALPCVPPAFDCQQLVPSYFWYNHSGVNVRCEGCYRCEDEVQQRREACEEILCNPVLAGCLITVTREPEQLVDKNGHICPVCPVCLQYNTATPVG